jgi:hypothetical protein
MSHHASIRRARVCFAALIFICLPLCSAAAGASSYGWQPGFGAEGLAFDVTLVRSDSARLFLATRRDSTRIVKYERGNWDTIATGIGWIKDLVPDGAGLIAIGTFSLGDSIHGIMRWDGARWTGFGNPAAEVDRVVRYKGDLCALGTFGESDSNAIERWDGNAWHDLVLLR